MKTVRTISVSLETEHVASLDRLAKEWGSRSEAIRRLLIEHERSRDLQQMEQAYREYFADPANVVADESLTRELLSVSSWPGGRRKEGRSGHRRRAQG